jgi:hypothetical protein
MAHPSATVLTGSGTGFGLAGGRCVSVHQTVMRTCGGRHTWHDEEEQIESGS